MGSCNGVVVQETEESKDDTTDLKGLGSDVETKEESKSVSEPKKKGILILGGSFSPCHTEHVELLYEIKTHLEEHENFLIVAAYMVISTEGDLIRKLQSDAISFDHRSKMCALTASKYPWCHPSHIPFVFAMQYASVVLNKLNFNQFFGSNPLIEESELDSLCTVDCMGADWVSPRSIGGKRKGWDGREYTCFIARDGYNEGVKEAYDAAKAKGECEGEIFVNTECKPISSTLIRKHLLKLRGDLCSEIKGKGWTLKNEVNSEEKKKEAFRAGVKDMLHPDVIEYLIEHIADLWIAPKRMNQY